MNFLDRRTKINILQQKANIYNEEFDKLEQQGYDLDEIPIILKQREEAQKPVYQETLPFEESSKVIGVGSAFQQGYEGSHKVLSSTKRQYKNIDTIFKDYKGNNKDTIDKLKGYLYLFSEELEKQKEINKISKQEICKDHLEKILNIGQKMPRSNYREGFQFNDEFQNICDKQNFEYNYKKNDLKQYAEEYVRSKANLRKC